MDFKGLSGFSSERYRAGDRGVIVYLESTDDVFIFKKWFGNHLSRIEFKAVSGEKANGGCQAVLSKVNDEGGSNIPCYGVVDRDVLLLNIADDHELLWWEDDDETFFAAKPFGDKIFVLNRWELENYLLHPVAIHRRIHNRTMGNSEFLTADDLCRTMIEVEDDFIAVTVLSLISLKQSGRSPRERFGRDESGERLWEVIQERTQAGTEQIEAYKTKLIQFAQAQTDPIERWERLSRVLDGKRAMFRIDKHLNQRLCLQDIRGDLADDIANMDTDDSYLSNLSSWIESLSN